MNTAEQKSFLPVVWKLVLCIGGTALLPRSLSCATDTVCVAGCPHVPPVTGEVKYSGLWAFFPPKPPAG